MGKNNVCIICGKPCRIKYCKEHAYIANREASKRHSAKVKKVKFHGCDEDCLHCPYPDCLKPVAQMKPTKEVFELYERW